MILVCVITLYPFLYLVAQSFSSESAIVQGLVKVWPVEFNLTTYKSVISKVISSDIMEIQFSML